MDSDMATMDGQWERLETGGQWENTGKRLGHGDSGWAVGKARETGGQWENTGSDSDLEAVGGDETAGRS